MAYITAIVRATRDRAGAHARRVAPRQRRAAQAGAGGGAAGRAGVRRCPDDVKALAPAVLRHRVAVAPELELEGVTADAALRGDHREDRGAAVIVLPSRRWLAGARRRSRSWRRSALVWPGALAVLLLLDVGLGAGACSA